MTMVYFRMSDVGSVCRPDELEKYTHAATVQDLVTALLCGLERPAMSVQTAASWGYCDAATAAWETDKLAEAGFPVRLLPGLVHSEQSVGALAEPWEGIPAGTSVGECGQRTYTAHGAAGTGTLPPELN